MESVKTLIEILRLSGSEVKAYELGRRIRSIEEQQFLQFETGQAPYPWPIQRHARFALCFWQKQQSESPYIWFLQFPLDEQGFFNLACRDQFLDLVMQALGKDLSQSPNEQSEQALANNPYIFKPSEDKLAYFNARYKKDLGLAASTGYELSQQYLQGLNGWDNWQSLPLQGLADVVTRLDQDHNSETLCKALPQLPAPVLVKLLELIEHEKVDQSLSHQLATLHKQARDAAHPEAPALLRALAATSVDNLAKQAIDRELSSEADLATLVAIAGRLWPHLQDPTRLKRYLELAAEQEQALFEQLFGDLVALPELRVFVLAQLRATDNSPQLQRAIHALLSRVSQ